MERKRKLPARASARVEQVSKKRTATPPAERSVTPAAPTPPPKEPTPEPEAPPLPTSISASGPLPTVENEQSGDLLNSEFQSVQESGVLSESLLRSRQKWIHEGIFEKYWTKPTKRKGVVKEEPNNPPKDSMVKIGSVTITIEPHVIEATMFAIKDPKPPGSATPAGQRPVMQYGPPNGVMPPPPKPGRSATPQQSPKTEPKSTPQPLPLPQASIPPQAPQAPQAPQPLPQQLPAPVPPTQQPNTHLPPAAASPPPPITNSQTTIQPAPARAAAAPTTATRPTAPPSPGQPAAPQQQPPNTAGPAVKQEPGQPGSAPPRPQQAQTPGPPQAGQTTSAPSSIKPGTPQGKPAVAAQPGADPIIVTLAEKASQDPQLRDLMKRVAVGEASPDELKHFQGIIDQITADYKKKGAQAAKAESTVVEGSGKTVRYFCEEVRNILNIVLGSNPGQKSHDLKHPANSDHFVIHLLKRALDIIPFRESISRVAGGAGQPGDAVSIKTELEKYSALVKRNPAAISTGVQPIHHPPPTGPPQASHPGPKGGRKSLGGGMPTQQALRSKGPPPAPKPDICGIVFEFSGGTSDRYLFPKYSILEQTSPHEVVASFLIVRKGSKSEYGGNPELDYYQPVTIRLNTPTGKHLDNLWRVVAPADEVNRYMDDVMDNMTRAEYVLLAMRLPRAEKDTTQMERTKDITMTDAPAKAPGVLWKTSKAVTPERSVGKVPKAMDEDECYQKFIASVS